MRNSEKEEEEEEERGGMVFCVLIRGVVLMENMVPNVCARKNTKNRPRGGGGVQVILCKVFSLCAHQQQIRICLKL